MKTPTKRTAHRLAAVLAIAFATTSAWAEDRTVSANTTLTADTTVDALTVNSGVTLDLAGYSLTCSSLVGSGTITSTFTDLTSPSGAVTWITKFGTGNDVLEGDLRNNTTWPTNLFDNVISNNDSDRILVMKANLPLAVVYDFGTGVKKAVNKYKMYGESTGDKYTGRSPKDWKFEGSNDNTTWTQLDSQNNVTSWSNNESKEFPFTNNTAYRYYRITFNASNDDSWLELNELEFFGPGELHVNVPAGAEATVESLTISGNMKVVKDGEGRLNGVTCIGSNKFPGVLEVNGGSVTVGDALYVGGTSSAGGTGTLTINGGNVVVAAGKNTLVGYATGATGTINLNGGVLTTTRIASFHGSGSVNFNGGTLQANADHTDYIKDGVEVKVLAGCGTIDCNGHDIVIDSQWGASPGGMNFRGGNGNTISIGVSEKGRLVNYTGITSIASGTRLAVRNLEASKRLISQGIVVAGVPTVGDTIFTCTRGDGNTLDGVSLDNVKCPFVPGTTFALDDSKTNIVVTAVGTPLENYWTGNAGDGNLSNPANWANGVPGSGENANIFCAAPATLTKGDTFAPASITFLEVSAAVTIDGDTAFENITEIVSLSSSSHTINVPVRFAGDIQVKQAAMAETSNLTKPHVTFAGGAYAALGFSLESGNSAAVYSRCIFGKYYLASTSKSRWTAQYQGSSKRVCVADGSSLYVPYAGNVSELYVAAGAKVDIGDMNTSARPAYQVYGEMVVTNLTATGSTTIYATHGQGLATPGVFKFGTVTNAMSKSGGVQFYFADGGSAAGSHVFYIGKGGVNYKTATTTIYIVGRDIEGNSETIRPWDSDFTIGARPGDDNPAGLRFFRDVEFCTDDENGTGRTIKLEARTQVQANRTAAITVSGSGTLKVTQPDDNGAQPTVMLAGTATLEYTRADATLGTGTLTLGAGTKFAFQNSGNTLALPSPIALPTDGAATLRIGGDRLASGKHTIATDVAADAAGHLIVDPESAALAGRKATLAVEDGNLVLNILSGGLMVIFR